MQEDATHKNFLLVQKRGNGEVTKKYMIIVILDMIIALGYRIQSEVAGDLENGLLFVYMNIFKRVLVWMMKDSNT